MYEFAMGTEEQFKELERTLNDGLTHVYDVTFPVQVSPTQAIIGLYQVGENFAIDLKDFHKYSCPNSINLPLFESLIKNGTVKFMSFTDMELFFRNIAVAFEPEGMTTTIINYNAENPFGLDDCLFQFQFEKKDLRWYAWIRRMPDLKTRDTSLARTHRIFDEQTQNHYVCWNTPLRTLHDVQTVAILWADKITEYIATGKDFGGRGES